jgi:CheY-like chemotaxis protein
MRSMSAELPGFRVGPASLEVRNDPSPNSNQHLQVVVLDVDVDGIDNYEAIQRSLQQSTRAIAHAAFFLNVALQWPSSFPAVLSESSERLNAVTQWAPPPVVVPYNSLPFSDPLRRGRWGSDFTFTWRDPEQPSVVNGPLFPLSAVAVLRRVRKKDAIADAFDSCTRLYHLSQLVPGGFLSAAAALKIASIDALAQGLPEFCTERGDRARFTSFMTQHGRTSASDADRLYKRWRSAILHAGRFARIDGAYAHIDFIDDAMESEELQRVPETIRWAYAGWVASVASDVPSST